ncbi:MAG: hypothetical protein ACK5P3_25300, partial [Dolichospermum sp.]
EQLSTQNLRKISLKSSFLRDLCAWSGSLFHESCVSPISNKNLVVRESYPPTVYLTSNTL